MSRHEDAIKSCYSTWSRSYYDEYYGEKAPYPPVHRDLIKRLLKEADVRTLLDAGCGPASFLRELTDQRLDLYGFDLTPQMVEEARRVLAEAGVPASHVWEGSVTDASAYRPPSGEAREFDAAVCSGVLPHVPKEADPIVIANLRGAVRDGGLVILEARNQLFSLFTLNRYSYEFFMSELLGDASPETLATVLPELQQRFRMDLPPVRKGKQDEPGYDEVLSRTHNPHVLRQQVADAGFKDVRLLFYHYHCLPPMFERQLGDTFRQLSLAMEAPDDWRGFYMASAFLVAARRA